MVDEEWRRITAWLTVHAPVAAQHLRPSTSAVPDELALARDWFEVQGGVGLHPEADVLMAYFPLSVEEALGHAHVIASLIVDWDDDWDVRYGGPASLVPVAWHGTGPLLVVDGRPGPDRGSVKELDWEDPSTLDRPLWPDLSSMLEDLAVALEQGTEVEVVGCRPEVVDGRIAWVWPTGEVYAGDGDDRRERTGSLGPWEALELRVAEAWAAFDNPRCLALIAAELDRQLALGRDDVEPDEVPGPAGVGTVDLDALIAACAEHVATSRGLPPPAWSVESWRSMRGRFPLVDFPSEQLRRLGSTPQAFVRHGFVLEWTG